MRSKLFVPGSRSELFSKALASQADAISIDLEDSVINSQKENARIFVTEFLRSDQVLSSTKDIIVRCNRIDSPFFENDIRSIVLPGLNTINIPKVESVNDILKAVTTIEEAEKVNGVVNSIPILVNIESPKGFSRMVEIASSHQRILGLQLGLNDLFTSLSISRHDIRSIHAVMLAVRMAAGEANVFAYDGAFPQISDEEGFFVEASLAKSLGFLGKSCIHPCQVAACNNIFTPSADEIAFANKIILAANTAEKEGLGAFTVDGEMIDLPAIRRAKSVVKISRKLESKHN
jgi:citrate lyase subunit beta/citryl-CoA lyase